MTDENVTPISEGKPHSQRPKDGDVEPVDLLPELRAKATPLIKSASQLDAAQRPADRPMLSKVGHGDPAPDPMTKVNERLALIETKLDQILATLSKDR